MTALETMGNSSGEWAIITAETREISKIIAKFNSQS
jgi:hypothetical protein